MKQPPGFTHPDYPHHVYKLTKAIYRLKQAPRAWFHRFSSFLVTKGFICSKTDNSMFIYCSSLGVLILLLYVDDIILTGSHSHLLVQFIDRLSHKLAMKDLGDLHYFLGVHAVRTSHGLHLCQQKYIVDLLLKFHMHTCKLVRTPIASRICVAFEDGNLLSDPSEYKSTVGALQYLTMTHPDIAHAVNIVSQFLHAPRTTHMHCVKRIFRYLQGTPTYGLFLRASSSNSVVTAYSDADWAGCPDTRHSTTGYVVFLGSNLISWHAKKQPTVFKSSTEAEYRAIAYTVAETTWIRHILCELRIYLRQPVGVFCDNVSSTYMCRNSVFHDRSKHIDVHFHYVRDKVSQGDLVVKYVPTQLQVVDIITKGLSSSHFCFLRDNLSVTTCRPD
ncbi:uncharacterized mitochondrial protein AtMg00810-like [Lycium barbarum]|uniref:uncharacterized mitochondrial protein AtMg00810-like n=1 Tax=Lycium barbarum TaxID=112863 RepID=UPI00293E3880|nr:uncharacterized mitochondrial protein AtMg00810-like [Lycium barbarum]